MAKDPDVMEPMEDLSIGWEEVQVCTSINYYGEKIANTKIENLADEEITEEYQQMTPVQRRTFNQLVQFHRDYEKTFGLAGSSTPTYVWTNEPTKTSHVWRNRWSWNDHCYQR